MKIRQPNGLSWRSLKRAVNSGWPAMQPDDKAMARHKWFRDKVFWAKQRIARGQARAGDKELASL